MKETRCKTWLVFETPVLSVHKDVFASFSPPALRDFSKILFEAILPNWNVAADLDAEIVSLTAPAPAPDRLYPEVLMVTSHSDMTCPPQLLAQLAAFYQRSGHARTTALVTQKTAHHGRMFLNQEFIAAFQAVLERVIDAAA